ncbi:MAG: aminoacyl--tRNA ligase-related protein [Patescibacteria group bacterium]
MLQSKLFGKTLKTIPKDEVSRNAELLIRGGFIDKLMAGAYSYLPLGYRVLNKIKNIIREEMNAIDGQELFMPALQPKALWEETGRWTDPGRAVMFQFKGREDKEYGLGWTHEEVIVDIARKRVSSYKDLPFALYQIQDKFRDEPRAKSGLLRGREFSMKDLYSFHATEKDLLNFYEKSKIAYLNVFKRCGLDALIVEASGGSFSKEFSHEFQVLTPFGEDTIFYCPNKDFAQNKEIAQVKAGAKCPICGEKITEGKAIEVGNIFKLYAKYSAPMKLQFTDAQGKKKEVIMGCYGIGPSRVMGAIAEVHNDKNGLIWPENVAPYKIHLLTLGESEEVAATGEKLYNHLLKNGEEVLFDNRALSPGAKFADADLIGIPARLVISEKTLAQESVEFKRRGEEKSKIKPLKEFYA